ncbi:MAG: hypothetical protein FJW83_00660 [Actinobacteria bacterium]|nr:hypothetical protein [Actinomycetota bacterium]
MGDQACRAARTTLGLAVLGLQQAMLHRRSVEAELERSGLRPAAEASRRVGALVERGLVRLVGGGTR